MYERCSNIEFEILPCSIKFTLFTPLAVYQLDNFITAGYINKPKIQASYAVLFMIFKQVNKF